MVFHLLHTMMPALDSRFTETAKNLSAALGSREGVSGRQQSRVAGCCFSRTAVIGSAESHGQYGRLHQAAPRWKHCVLETERGFNVVFRNVLSEKFHGVHREVRSFHGDSARDCRARATQGGGHLTEAPFTVSRLTGSFKTFFPPSSPNCMNSRGETPNLSGLSRRR